MSLEPSLPSCKDFDWNKNDEQSALEMEWNKTDKNCNWTFLLPTSFIYLWKMEGRISIFQIPSPLNVLLFTLILIHWYCNSMENLKIIFTHVSWQSVGKLFCWNKQQLHWILYTDSVCYGKAVIHQSQNRVCKQAANQRAAGTGLFEFDHYPPNKL